LSNAGSASVCLRYALSPRKDSKGETVKTAISAIDCFDEEGTALGDGADNSAG